MGNVREVRMAKARKRRTEKKIRTPCKLREGAGGRLEGRRLGERTKRENNEKSRERK